MFKLVGENIRGEMRGNREYFIDARVALKERIKVNIIIEEVRGEFSIKKEAREGVLKRVHSDG